MKTKIDFVHEGINFKDIEVDGKYPTGRGLSKVVRTFAKSMNLGKIKTRYSTFAGGDSIFIKVENLSKDDNKLIGIFDECFASVKYSVYSDCWVYKKSRFSNILCSDNIERDFKIKYVFVEKLIP